MRDAARARLAGRAKRFGVELYGNILSVEEREANAAKAMRVSLAIVSGGGFYDFRSVLDGEVVIQDWANEAARGE